MEDPREGGRRHADSEKRCPEGEQDDRRDRGTDTEGDEDSVAKRHGHEADSSCLLCKTTPWLTAPVSQRHAVTTARRQPVRPLLALRCALMRLTTGNLKGGVGKSTSAVFLACGLARAGRTLLIDADPQGSVLSWSEQAEDFPCTVIAWATRDLAKRVADVADDYAHVVIDTGPQNEPLLRQALAVTDQLLIPVSPTLMDAGRLGPTFDLVEDVGAFRSIDARVLLTKVRPTRSAKEAREGLEAQGLPLMASEVRLRETYATAADTVPRDLGEYESVLAELQTATVAR
jgi:chromosome partitioning protein